jgi:putative MATE family efflux protein
MHINRDMCICQEILDEEAPPPNPPARAIDARTRELLDAAIVPLLLRLAWPNILVMLAQSSTGLIEMWFVAKLGTDALTGMALVMPVLILMQNMSLGAIGGGISSAVARALGAGRRDDADRHVLHALVINVSLGAAFAVIGIAIGPMLYRVLGGSGASLDAALTYSTMVFIGMIPLWVFNGLTSVIRGTGNMLVPGMVTCIGAVLLVPLSPALIFGWGPFPALGVAGGGAALIIYYLAGTIVLGWYVASGRNLARFRLVPIRWAPIKEILRVGAVGAVNTVQINVTIGATMALVAAHAGSTAVAGFGTGTRLEYLLPPLAFGIGAPLVALVGANIGAGQNARALRIAFIGSAIAFLLTELVGLSAAIWPAAWLGLFGHDPELIEVGSTYLRIVGPCFGFFGIGIALYFSSQGAGRLAWPLVAGLLRITITIGGGALVLHLTGSLAALLIVYAAGMVTYGLVIAAAVGSGRWFR